MGKILSVSRNNACGAPVPSQKRGVEMANSTDRRLEQQIEETQAALRQCIEEARELADRAQRLLQRQNKNEQEHR
jgi:hypothetical protein